MTITGDRPPDRRDTSARDRCQRPARDRHGPAGPAVRPATREALICKHVTGSRTCPLEAAGVAVAGHHVHDVKEYLGGTHR
jgi:hypothetical protein